MRRGAAWSMVALLAATLLGGCLDPFRPHVDAAVLASTDGWTMLDPESTGGGLYGYGLVRTDYEYGGAGGPPWPGLLSVVGIRGLSRLDTGALLDRARDRAADLLEEQGVEVEDAETEGTRTLRSGVSTEWFLLIGHAVNETVPGESALFDQDQEIRVLAETWYDGRSKTHVIAIALAQTTGPTGLLGEGNARDHRTWNQLVGDPAGGVAGAYHDQGFLYHMVSHD